MTLALAATITTAYLAASAFGSFAGGYVADLTRNHDRVVGAGLLGAALMALLIGYAPMPAILVFAAAVTMGFLSGLTIPSRDMLVRAATPARRHGKSVRFRLFGARSRLARRTGGGRCPDRSRTTPYAFRLHRDSARRDRRGSGRRETSRHERAANRKLNSAQLVRHRHEGLDRRLSPRHGLSARGRPPLSAATDRHRAPQALAHLAVLPESRHGERARAIAHRRRGEGRGSEPHQG